MPRIPTISSCHDTTTTDTLPLPTSLPGRHYSHPIPRAPYIPSTRYTRRSAFFQLTDPTFLKDKNTLKTSNGKNGRRAESHLPQNPLNKINKSVGESVGIIVLGPLAEVHQVAVVDHEPPATTHHIHHSHAHITDKAASRHTFDFKPDGIVGFHLIHDAYQTMQDAGKAVCALPSLQASSITCWAIPPSPLPKP